MAELEYDLLKILKSNRIIYSCIRRMAVYRSNTLMAFSYLGRFILIFFMFDGANEDLIIVRVTKIFSI